MAVTPTVALIDSTMKALCGDSDEALAKMNETQTVYARAKYVQFLIRCGAANAGLNQARIYAGAVEIIWETMPNLSLDANEAAVWRERAAPLIFKALPEAKADSDLVKLLLQLRDQLLQPPAPRPS
jgi:hypothetical protein